MFDMWDVFEYESIFPGALTGGVDVVCGNCGCVYEVQVDGSSSEVVSVCPECNAVNES